MRNFLIFSFTHFTIHGGLPGFKLKAKCKFL
jgi:hypothetical protein